MDKKEKLHKMNEELTGLEKIYKESNEQVEEYAKLAEQVQPTEKTPEI